MSDHDRVLSESGLGDGDCSPVWTDDDRPRIPRVAGEREALAAYLDHYRAPVELKCRGLTPDQARSRAVPCRRPPCRCTAWCDTSPAWSAGGSSRTSSA